MPRIIVGTKTLFVDFSSGITTAKEQTQLKGHEYYGVFFIIIIGNSSKIFVTNVYFFILFQMTFQLIISLELHGGLAQH